MTVDDSAQKIHTKSGILTQHCQQCHTQTVDNFLGQIDPEKISQHLISCLLSVLILEKIVS